ncbi:glycerol-3-phosphate dehydrogenase/oxidase [Chitinophaga terrae (ex Kim and Jung 2007)]|nr:glycerol-3-phosphate dehydrogenase/oxidase [Chitinophaga terrae (ex Kim and Jung 2007)]MDQ0108720.1 glycerol-3-phosphate dehydrogenase [Chitinophaga terrae (ex Kim and Jung 2007)]GEP89715.1 glycerol-3-phosphate dehydrogenase [Chitinophaga terrae (ex Kim and Jung 2007)]
MKRIESIQQVRQSVSKSWDMIIIGGGATGLGVAMDAAKRGFKTVLLEQADFAKGTSSRSTKLVHGGVRYLAQGDVALVREALYERGLLLANAPHLAHNQQFVIPQYRWWDGPFYTIGLKIYDLLSGKLSLGKSMHIGKQEVLRRLPNIREKGLKGGIVYHDGQFDDARLAVNIAQTAAENGAVLLNYCKVKALQKTGGKVSGVIAEDLETGEQYQLQGKTVINATGVFVDEVLQMDNPSAPNMVRPSQGVHLVLDASFLNSSSAVMIPKTSDGRVLFAVPWHNKVLLGTTDTPLDQHSLEPVALEEEINFILNTAGAYLTRAPQRKDVLSVFAGLRPLAAPQKNTGSTKEISRSHKILVADSGLITITGGKWTTFRKMAEDVVDMAIKKGGLLPVNCTTRTLRIHGYQQKPAPAPFDVYGSDAAEIESYIVRNPAMGAKLHPALPYVKAQVIWAVQNEMAVTVEDVLARRLRALFLDAAAAIEMAPAVAALMATVNGKDAAWQQQQVEAFTKMAGHYLLNNENKRRQMPLSA